MNIAVLASGRGTNFAAILRAVKKGKIPANISLLVCDNSKASVIGKAKRAGVGVFLIKRDDFASKGDFENRIIQRLEEAKIDLIVLAGFMRILSRGFVQKFNLKIVNIHPALLPSFKGTQGVKDAFDYGVKIAGVTVHFVDSEMDHGPIILQAAVKIDEQDSQESLEKKIHKIEHKLYPQAIRLFCEGRLEVGDRRVRIK